MRMYSVYIAEGIEIEDDAPRERYAGQVLEQGTVHDDIPFIHYTHDIVDAVDEAKGASKACGKSYIVRWDNNGYATVLATFTDGIQDERNA